MKVLFTILVTFFAGMGAGLGTGFAGMSAAAKILAADRFITGFPVLTAKPAAFIAQKLHLVFFWPRQCLPSVIGFI